MARRQRGHTDLSVAAQRTWRWNWVKQDRETTGEGRKGQAQSTHLYTGRMSGNRVGPRPGQQGRDRKEAEGADWWDSMAGPCGTSAEADVRRKNMYVPGSESVHKTGIGRHQAGQWTAGPAGVPLNCRPAAT